MGIMDPQTITLYAPEQWTERFFGQEVNAQKHVIVLYSREGESYWLHTRGMAEFGRPDIGISGVPEGKVDAYKLNYSWGCSYYFFLDDEFEGSGDLSDPLPVYELVFRL